MPTDGADFGRRVHCYGRVYTAARQGATPEELAPIVVAGAERDIRTDKGVPVFKELVLLLVQATQSCGDAQRVVLLRKTDELRAAFAEHSLSRPMIDAAEKVALASINSNRPLSAHEASDSILGQFINGRCCDHMDGYLTRHRTHSYEATQGLIHLIEERVSASPALHDLGRRMLNASNSGLPERASKPKPIVHTAAELGSIVIGNI